ncbi:hypothetical protein N7478_001311 [Penicillium angulare]|uniref:uncharacterized protein n=1 Tax=Penicillium angulare TaxID=116970 RepID=UPI002540A359|nr:uncharacterized protein N7478_001311 [Penicillium angulare]KAJ5292060.1 hypothetical protein N7478_001311 [Penicillium angulare]
MSSVGSLLVSREAELVYSRSPAYPREHSQTHKTMVHFQIALFLVVFGVLLPFAYVSSVVKTLAEVEDSNSNSYIRLEDHGSNPT